MWVQTIIDTHEFILKILNEKKKIISSKGHISVLSKRNICIYIRKLLLLDINIYAEFKKIHQN